MNKHDQVFLLEGGGDTVVIGHIGRIIQMSPDPSPPKVVRAHLMRGRFEKWIDSISTSSPLPPKWMEIPKFPPPFQMLFRL
jgi:hypothetical protein